MQLYVRRKGRWANQTDIDTGPYSLHTLPNTDGTPKSELICRVCNGKPVWQGASAQMGALVNAILRHESESKRHRQTERR